MDVSFEDAETHLSVRCAGEWEPGRIEAVLVRIKEEAAKGSQTRVLVDALDLAKPPSEFSRFEAGRNVAEHLRRHRVAVLYPSELVNKFTEDAAVNRGATMLVTGDRATALEWLLKGAAEGSSEGA